MARLRSFYDADRIEDHQYPTAYKTAENQNEVYCGVCGEMFFINDLLFDDVNKIIEKTLENPFVCEDCWEEYDELGHRE